MSDLELEIEKLERRLGLNQVNRPKPQVLVVDDDRDIRASVYDVLSGLFEIKVCQDGGKALSCCTSKTQVVLLDIKIQGKNGLEIFDELKKTYPDMPIIFFTALSDNNEAYLRSKRLAPFAVLEKGCSLKSLIYSLQKAIIKRNI